MRVCRSLRIAQCNAAVSSARYHEETEQIVQNSILFLESVLVTQDPERRQKPVCPAVSSHELTTVGFGGTEVRIGDVDDRSSDPFDIADFGFREFERCWVTGSVFLHQVLQHGYSVERRQPVFDRETPLDLAAQIIAWIDLFVRLRCCRAGIHGFEASNCASVRHVMLLLLV